MRHEDLSRELFEAVRAGDIVRSRAALAAGANLNLGKGKEAALHIAARSGSLALVEPLLEGEALEWQTDRCGRTPLDLARLNRSPDRDAIVAVLDRTRIADPDFRAAVAALHAGDLVGLERLLDAKPNLLQARNMGPEVYRRAKRKQYFRDPKLFWYVANNPNFVATMPDNLVELVRAMLARGVESADVDYALELTMTSGGLGEGRLRAGLMRVLLVAGAKPSPATVVAVGGEKQLDALRSLLDNGYTLTLPVAAAIGASHALGELLEHASAQEIQIAFGLAVINDHLRCARMALAAGAEVDAYLPYHAHSTALHQAALNDNVDMIELLATSGARADVRDLLWDGTPAEWAQHEGRARALSALEALFGE